MADQQRKIYEGTIVRWACYLGFVLCSVSLIITLGDWRALLLGTIVYGALALAMYRQEETRQENLDVIRGAQRAQAGGSNFDFGDDPTTPPMRKN